MNKKVKIERSSMAMEDALPYDSRTVCGVPVYRFTDGREAVCIGFNVLFSRGHFPVKVVKAVGLTEK